MASLPPHLLLQLLILAAGSAVIALLLWPLRSRRPGAATILLLLIAALIVSGASLWTRQSRAAIASNAQLLAAVPHLGQPAAEFTTSDSCRACHAHQYVTWHGTYHRRMTQLATTDTVTGPVDDVRLHNRGRDYHLTRKGREIWVNMVDPEWEHAEIAAGRNPDAAAAPPRVDRRVVMTTGSHHQQTLWVSDRNLYNVPFVFLMDDQRWVPREDVFLRPPQAGRGHDTWNDNCIECHAVAGESNLDPLSSHADSAVAELGIACEACHGPGREHIRANRDPRRRYRYHSAQDGDPTIVQPQRLSAQAATHVCGQCHSMNVFKLEKLEDGTRYRAGGDLTEVKMILRTSDARLTEAERRDWPRLQMHLQRQGPTFLDERFWPDGMVRVSGREQNALLESPCFAGGEFSCLSCHQMHGSPADDQLAPRMNTNDACLRCHSEMAADITSHTHHAPSSSGSQCYNCHMPHTTYGLLKAIRSHQVSSPSVQSELDTGRPSACTLCHLDQPLSFTARHLEQWHGQPQPPLDAHQQQISSAVLHSLRGDANQRALVAWHMGWSEAHAAAGRTWMAPYLAHLLEDPYPAVRYIAHRSLKRLPGFEQFQFDFLAQPASLQKFRRKAISIWYQQQSRGLDRRDPAVLIGPNGAMNGPLLAELAGLRNDRPVDLRE